MKIFYIYRILLIFSAIAFAAKFIKECKTYFEVKKEYCLAPYEIKPGHAQPPVKSEYEPWLKSKRFELVAWFLILAVNVYAIYDCGNWI